MRILPDVTYSPSPNHGGQLVAPKFLVIHYTGGASLESSVSWLRDKQSKASAHLVIGKSGAVHQLVPFDTVAWHAGESTWKGLDGLNKYSIGIELDNRGPLFLRKLDGQYRGVSAGGVVDPVNVYTGKHAYPKCGFQYWEKFPDVQVAALRRVIDQLWTSCPSLVEIVGHDDIAPGRKFDPGPAAGFMPELKAEYKR